MAGMRDTVRDVGMQAATMGARVIRGVVRRVANRVASRLRDQVDLENEPPSRPAPQPDRPSNLVVTPPPGGRTGTRVPTAHREAASSVQAPASSAEAPSASLHSQGAGQPAARDLRLFERVQVRQSGASPVIGEIYDVQGAAFDVLTYTDEGLPQLLTGLSRDLLSPA